MPSRFLAPALSALTMLVALVGALFDATWLWLALIAGTLTAIGVRDLTQTRQAIRRNYPILAHFRFFFESIRPEIRQYFLESDTEQTPFSRAQRSIVYQRAKSALDKRPFGTLVDVYASGHEWINHSLAPRELDQHDFRIKVGGPQCTQPYDCSVLNISAMSFGALSANAIMALNGGARRGNFYHDTGEGSISRHHRVHGGDLVWEIGSGYFGCRHADGSFSAERFAENASAAQVKMIELKLSQGAKPGHGGVLPGPKVSAEIAEARGVPAGVDCISPAAHSAFATPVELLEFVGRLRDLAGGKPVGFKLAIGHPWEFFSIAKAILKTGIRPDFIIVDGGEGGTGAAPVEFADHVGAPLTEALLLVHNTLVGTGLRADIRIGTAGKIITAFDMARTIALGADWCNAARGFMFALGCIQSLSCHTSSCPTGVATQDPWRQRALVPEAKIDRVFNFHQNTLKALKELIGAAGLMHPRELGPEHVIRRVSRTEIRSLAALHHWVKPNELIDGGVSDHPVFNVFWAASSADSFAQPPNALALRSRRGMALPPEAQVAR